jgi:hypothetical protein
LRLKVLFSSSKKLLKIIPTTSSPSQATCQRCVLLLGRARKR